MAYRYTEENLTAVELGTKMAVEQTAPTTYSSTFARIVMASSNVYQVPQLLTAEIRSFREAYRANVPS
jgi:hypothetical protein